MKIGGRTATPMHRRVGIEPLQMRGRIPSPPGHRSCSSAYAAHAAIRFDGHLTSVTLTRSHSDAARRGRRTIPMCTSVAPVPARASGCTAWRRLYGQTILVIIERAYGGQDRVTQRLRPLALALISALPRRCDTIACNARQEDRHVMFRALRNSIRDLSGISMRPCRHGQDNHRETLDQATDAVDGRSVLSARQRHALRAL